MDLEKTGNGGDAEPDGVRMLEADELSQQLEMIS